MISSASMLVVPVAVLLVALAVRPVGAQDLHDDVIGCWSAAYEYDSLHGKDGSPTGAARLCSREPSAKACGKRNYLDATYCFDRKGNAYGGEMHCWSAPKGQICHGTDGLSGFYRVQGNRMNFYNATDGEENGLTQELAWSCSFSVSGSPDVLEFADCTQPMKTFFRDCAFSSASEEYKTDRCEPSSK